MAEKSNRTKEIKIRLTIEEHEALLKKMVGRELATWMRNICLDQKNQKPIKTADPILLTQLAKIGGNLNQIARAANTEQTQGNLIDRIKLTAELAIIREQLSEILKHHDC